MRVLRKHTHIYLKIQAANHPPLNKTLPTAVANNKKTK